MRNNGLGEVAGQVPLCTLAFATLCVGLQGYVFLFGVEMGNYVLIPARVIYLGEYYRVITAALLHGGLMHIMFNMMSFLSIGSGLEMATGTLSLLFTILWSMILGGAIHCGSEWAMTVWITHDMGYVNQASVGFSGVIFTLALMESYRSTQPTRPVFGMIQVPTRMYPWVLLVMLSVLMPGISFAGHLSGILVGVLHVYGLTKPIMPSPAFYIEMESYWWVRNSIGQRHNFVPCPQTVLPTTAEEQQQQQTISSWKIICALKHDAAADEYNNEALPALFSLRPASGPWYRCCGPTLAAVGAGRRSLSSCLHSLTGRLRGLRSSGAPGSGASNAANASGGVGSHGHDAEARGRLLPWGA